MIFSLLPMDVIRHILSYSDSVKYRNGLCMGQISKSDARYDVLLRIPPILSSHIFNNVYEVNIWKHVSCDYIYKETNTTLYVDLQNDAIVYTFCYDVENNPDGYHLWIRNA